MSIVRGDHWQNSWDSAAYGCVVEDDEVPLAREEQARMAVWAKAPWLLNCFVFFVF